MSGDPRDGEAPERTPPANVQAELGLIGAILLNNRAYDRVAEFLEPEHFVEPLHQKIYAACKTLIDRGEKADPATLHHHFAGEHAVYVAKTAASATTIINAADYGHVIHDLHIRRQLIAYAGRLETGAYTVGLDVTAGDLVEDAREGLALVSDELRAEESTVSIGAAAGEAIDAAERAAKSQGKLLGLPTGVMALDRHIHGLQAPDFVIVAGSTSMGKTAFALTVLRAVAKAGHKVGLISLEMSARQIGERLLAMETGYSVMDIRAGFPQPELGTEPWSDLLDARQRLDAMPVDIDDGSALTPERIAAIGRRWKTKALSLLIVDYLQLVKPPAATLRFGPVAQITAISAALKALAKSLDVPLVALSQLSRANQARENKRPTLADLRQSGALEQDADIVIFLHRPDYYLERERPDPDSNAFTDWELQLSKVRGRAEIIVAKQRQGSLAVHDVRFDQKIMQFTD